MAERPEHLPTPTPPPPGRPDHGLPDRPEHPIVPPATPKRPKTDGPDVQTALPVPGGDTVPTSLGQLDRSTVMNNQVGGVGVVHMHADPQELPLTEGPMDKTGPVGDRSHDKK